jgi:hypothetical protein
VTIRELKQAADAEGWREFGAWLLRHLGDEPGSVWRKVPNWVWLLFWAQEELNREHRQVPGPLRRALGQVLEHAALTCQPRMPTLAARVALFADSSQWPAVGYKEARAILVTTAQDFERRADMVGRRLARSEGDRRQAELWWGASCWLRACYQRRPGDDLVLGACHVADSGLRPESRQAFRDLLVRAWAPAAVEAA